MSFLSFIFKRKSSHSSAQETPQPRYKISKDTERAPYFEYYTIHDNQENMILKLNIIREIYDSRAIESCDYFNPDKYGCASSVIITVGDIDDVVSPHDLPRFRFTGHAFNKKLGRLATFDDSDYTLLKTIESAMQNTQNPKEQQQACLAETLLTEIGSKILTSALRITPEYIESQKQKEQAEREKKAQELEENKRSYYEQQEKKAEMRNSKKQAAEDKADQYMRQLTEKKLSIK